MVDYERMSYSFLVPEHLRGKRFATVVWTVCICDEHTRRQLEEEYSTDQPGASTLPPNSTR